jgi:phage major head subunit gpT-like protein
LYAGDADVIVNWEQTTTTDNDWYLVNVNASFKPIIIQDRKPPDWNVWDDSLYKYVKYGFDFRMGYAALNPFCIVKTNN